MRKRVMILGASRYYVKSIEATRDAGYYVIAVDRDSAAYGFRMADAVYVCDISDQNAVLNVARKARIDAIVPVNDFGVPTAAFVASALGLNGISEEAAQAATNKGVMRARWQAAGLRCPAFVEVRDDAEVYGAIETIGLPCILKPAEGTGGASRGVIVVRHWAELQTALAFTRTFSPRSAILVEEFFQAETEHSVEVIVHNGAPHVIAVGDKIKTPLPYRVDKNVVYPTLISGSKLAALHRTVRDAVIALDIGIGAAHVELGSAGQDFVLYELGARCGGGGTPEPIVPYVTGVREFVEVVRILAGDEPRSLVPISERACNYHFLTPKPGKIARIRGFASIQRHEAVLDADIFVNEGDEIGPVRVGTDRSGFMIVTGSNREEAIQLGYHLESRLQISYAD